MSKPRLTEATIRNLTTAQSFSRGQAYLRDGAVLEIEQRDDFLLAEVEGSEYEPYQVRVRLDGGVVMDAECACPYDWGGYCKHIVAVLLAFVQQPDRVTERTPVVSLLSDLDREALVNLLTDLLATHPHLADWVETRIAAREGTRQVELEAAAGPRQCQTTLDSKPFHRQVRSILRGLGQMRPSEAYWATGSTVDQVREVMMQAQPFLEAGDGRNALVILEAVADEYVDTWFEFDDSDGELGAFFGELGPMFAEALLSADLSPSGRKSNSFLAIVGKDPFDAPEANAEQAGQVLLAQCSTLHQRFIHQSVYAYPPKLNRPFPSQHLRVSLIKDRKLDSNFSTAFKRLTRRFIDIDGLVGDLPQVSSVAGLFINELL
jgi:uncharacterized Zn finger protein